MSPGTYKFISANIARKYPADFVIRGAISLNWAVIIGALIIGVSIAPATARAQGAPPPDNAAAGGEHAKANRSDEVEPATKVEQTDDAAFFGVEHRRQLYDQAHLSTRSAVLRNLLLPGLGNIYAEQYFYAGIAFSFMVFAASFVSYGLITDQSEFLWIGAATAGIAYAGSITTGIFGVRAYNRKLREGLKIETARVSPASPFTLPAAPTVEIGWRF